MEARFPPIAVSHIGFEAKDAVPETYRKIVKDACSNAFAALRAGSPYRDGGRYHDTKLRYDAVHAALCAAKYQEDHELVNAGRGSDPAADGTIITTAGYMDTIAPVDFTSIMGAWFRHPSKAAILLQGRKHTRLVDPGATKFYIRHVAEPAEKDELLTLLKERELKDALINGTQGITGTAGDVTLDAHGNMASVTTTGGLVAVEPGRESDVRTTSATYTWKNRRTGRMAGVSGTGRGENTATAGVAQTIVDAYTRKGSELTPEGAMSEGFLKLEDTNIERPEEWRGEAGFIGIFVDEFGKVRVAKQSNFGPTDIKYFMWAYVDPESSEIVTF